MNANESLKRELLLEIQRCAELYNSQVFTNRSVFTQAAFIELLIRLNYILQELRKKNKRVIWTDDVLTDNTTKDVTDLVNNLRNAACHSDSLRNYVTNTSIKFVLNTFVGRSPNAVQIGDQFLGNEYKDDIAFYYGDKRIYLVRHIKRLLEELPNEIAKLS